MYQYEGKMEYATIGLGRVNVVCIEMVVLWLEQLDLLIMDAISKYNLYATYMFLYFNKVSYDLNNSHTRNESMHGCVNKICFSFPHKCLVELMDYLKELILNYQCAKKGMLIILFGCFVYKLQICYTM